MAQLLNNEVVVRSTRAHWSLVAPGMIAVGVVCLLGLELLHLVPATVAGHNPGPIVNPLRWLLLVIGVLAIGIRYLQWHAAVYMLTNKRIVVSRGVVSKVTESITLDRIQDVIMRRSLGERLVGAGSVDIESAGRDGIEVLHRIAHPNEFYRDLMEAVETHRTGGGEVTPPAASTASAPSQETRADGV